jgi:hypothetical protein
MNLYNHHINDETNREPILRIWREIKAREQMTESSSELQEESSDEMTDEQTVN